MKKKEIAYLAIVILLAVSLSIENYLVLKADSNPFLYEVRITYHSSASLYDLASKGNITGFLSYYNTKYVIDYPPMIVFQAFPFYHAMGISEDAAAFSNIIHIFILLLSAYFIGKKMKNEEAGLLSAIFISSCFWIHAFSRAYLPDIAVSAFFALSTAFLLYSDGLNNTKYSIFYGVSLGLGMLAKYSFIVFALPLFSIYFIRQIFSASGKKSQKKKIISFIQLKNISIVIALFCLLICTWYPERIFAVYNIVVNANRHFTMTEFPNMNFFERTSSILGQYFSFLADHAPFSSCFIAFALLLIYSFVSGALKVNANRFAFGPFELLCSASISFLPFVFQYPVIRFVLSTFIVLFICIGVAIEDIISRICILFPLNKRFMAKILLISAISALILFPSLAYLWKPETYKSELYDNIFEDGLSVPKQFEPYPEEIIGSMNHLDNSSIMLLGSSDIIYSVYDNLSNGNAVFNAGYCLTWPDLFHSKSDCNIAWTEMIGLASQCKYDIVIDASPRFSIYNTRIVEDIYPERKELYDSVISKWDACRSQYSVFKQFNNFPLDVNELQNITIYKKMGGYWD